MVLDVILTIIGGLCLVVGLVAALVSNRYAAMKVLLAKNPMRTGSLLDDPKARADRWFYTGLGLTALGIILQVTAVVRSLLRGG